MVTLLANRWVSVALHHVKRYTETTALLASITLGLSFFLFCRLFLNNEPPLWPRWCLSLRSSWSHSPSGMWFIAWLQRTTLKPMGLQSATLQGVAPQSKASCLYVLHRRRRGCTSVFSTAMHAGLCAALMAWTVESEVFYFFNLATRDDSGNKLAQKSTWTITSGVRHGAAANFFFVRSFPYFESSMLLFKKNMLKTRVTKHL